MVHWTMVGSGLAIVVDLCLSMRLMINSLTLTLKVNSLTLMIRSLTLNVNSLNLVHNDWLFKMLLKSIFEVSFNEQAVVVKVDKFAQNGQLQTHRNY